MRLNKGVQSCVTPALLMRVSGQGRQQGAVMVAKCSRSLLPPLVPPPCSPCSVVRLHAHHCRELHRRRRDQRAVCRRALCCAVVNEGGCHEWCARRNRLCVMDARPAWSAARDAALATCWRSVLAGSGVGSPVRHGSSPLIHFHGPVAYARALSPSCLRSPHRWLCHRPGSTQPAVLPAGPCSRRSRVRGTCLSLVLCRTRRHTA